jgi:hypothetical protein
MGTQATSHRALEGALQALAWEFQQGRPVNVHFSLIPVRDETVLTFAWNSERTCLIGENFGGGWKLGLGQPLG